MTEITLHLTDEQARQLMDEAQRSNSAIEEIAISRLFGQAGDAVSEEFRREVAQVIREDAELLRRLA